ncbi:Hypp18 [Branchiostoma lanceolatum]|uniref:Hypp18 protein n=1 Tax=Branchiostoma lanceolatum TaxID=7740 RepID=A0A8J9WB90_BRALA|nr:Hypp18 [Branchiostoma lanceolatum]
MADIGGHDSTFSDTKEGGEEGADVEQIYDAGENDSDFEGPQTEIGGSSTDGSKETKKAVPAFLAAAAKEIGGKVVSKLGDRIAEGVVENHQDKVVNGLQNYLGKQMDKFDDEYKDLLKDTSSLAAGLNRPVEEADIQLVPRPGATMGNMYAPPGWEIRHKYKYKDDRNEDKDSSGGQTAAYTYPNGLGPVLMNGCFGTGYENGDPCWEAKIPQEGCPNMIDGATYLGVGFDGRGVYSAESRKKSVIQRSCENLQTYGKHEVPDSMTPQGIYDTNVESYTFSSMEEYRQYLAEKSAVTSAKAMFQEEIFKASGHVSGGGAFGLGWSVGGGVSSQSGSSSQSSDFSASSSASARLSEKQTRTFMAMLEINIFRYEIFMDDVTPDQLNVGFVRDFISLPESYFSPGAEITFQNFYLRWGTHYIKSAKFGGQLKIIKTKQATEDLSMSEFATKAEKDWKMTMSTFSALASQTKSSSWWHEHETKTESKQSSGQAASGSQSQANSNQEKQESSQEYSNEMLEVQGGDQQIAAAITEMYTTALTTELKDWLESIDDYPKPFSFVLRPVSDLLNIPFASLFPAGEVDYGCFGERKLRIEEGTGRKYYIQETTKQVGGDKGSKNGSEAVTVSEIRYCNFANRKDLEDSMTKRRLSLERAVTVYLEEGRLLSSDFLLPAGEPGCETAMLAFLQGNNADVPSWEDMIGGNEFTVVFDMPYGIPGILQAQDVLELKFFRHKWFSTRRGSVPHLYDSYKNGGSNDVQGKKVSVQGLAMTYDEQTGVFTVTDDDFEASAPLIPDLPNWIKGRDIARAEYKKLLDHLSQKSETVGDVPCGIHWSNAHRFDPTDGGKCIHFTAASEGDIFVVFASIPQNHETWIYIHISPEGVALYKALRLQTTQLNDNAGGLGSATLYQSYFVCVTEDVEKKTTVIQYGKTPDNEERPHVWLSFTFHESASLRYYSFGSGESPVKVMGLSVLGRPANDFIVCRQGTEMINGACQQKCHSECDGCRTSGSDSPTDCIDCKHLKVSYPYRERGTGDFECVAQCPQHMQPDTASKTCTCIKRMEEARPGGVVDCVTECPLTDFDDNNVCKKCSSFCTDVSGEGKRVCSGPAAKDCETCKYRHEGRCVEGCSPGQKAVPGSLYIEYNTGYSVSPEVPARPRVGSPDGRSPDGDPTRRRAGTEGDAEYNGEDTRYSQDRDVEEARPQQQQGTPTPQRVPAPGGRLAQKELGCPEPGKGKGGQDTLTLTQQCSLRLRPSQWDFQLEVMTPCYLLLNRDEETADWNPLKTL